MNSSKAAKPVSVYIHMCKHMNAKIGDLDEREKCKVFAEEIADVDNFSVLKMFFIYLW